MKQQNLTLTNGEINGAHEAMTALLPDITDVVVSWKLGQNIKAMQTIAGGYQDSIRAILAENGAKHDGTKYVQINGQFQWETVEGAAVGNAAIVELANIESDISYYPLSLARLDGNKKELDTKLLLFIHWMINDDTD